MNYCCEKLEGMQLLLVSWWDSSRGIACLSVQDLLCVWGRVLAAWQAQAKARFLMAPPRSVIRHTHPNPPELGCSENKVVKWVIQVLHHNTVITAAPLHCRSGLRVAQIYMLRSPWTSQLTGQRHKKGALEASWAQTYYWHTYVCLLASTKASHLAKSKVKRWGNTPLPPWGYDDDVVARSGELEPFP